MRFLLFALMFLLPALADASDNFSCTVENLYYHDANGRTINYDFSSGIALPNGSIQLPASALTLPASETNAQYFLSPAPWSNPDTTWNNGVYRLAVPQPQIAPEIIPSASGILIDGAFTDWVSVPFYCTDAAGETSVIPLAGIDVNSIKLAYTNSNSRLACLLTLNEPASTGVVYRFFLDNNLNDEIGDVGDYQIDIVNFGNGWEVVSQGWTSENGEWYNVTEQGTVAVSGKNIEFSVDAWAFALPAPVNIICETRDAQYYSTLDIASNPFRESEQLVAINGTGISDANSGQWTYSARFKDFENNSMLQRTYSCGLAAGSFNESTTGFEFEAIWFSGKVEGQTCDHALVFFAEIGNDQHDYWWEWSSVDNELMLTGFDLHSTIIDLKAEISALGRHIDFYYRTNSDSQWELLASHDLDNTVPPLNGFPYNFPAISLNSQLMTNPYDLNGDTTTNLADLAIIARSWLSSQNQSSYNELCDISDPADGIINYKDLAVILENWLMP